MAKRGCAASSPGKLWTITSMEKVRINSRCSERAARSSRRRYGGNMLLATPKWMGLFSFARTIYLSDDLREEGPHRDSGLMSVGVWRTLQKTNAQLVGFMPFTTAPCCPLLANN